MSFSAPTPQPIVGRGEAVPKGGGGSAHRPAGVEVGAWLGPSHLKAEPRAPRWASPLTSRIGHGTLLTSTALTMTPDWLHNGVMELTGYVEALRNELAVAAATGGEAALHLAERLTGPLDSAARLVLQEALSDAAQEITRDLAPGSVELRLRGRELTFVVTPPPVFESLEQAPDDLPQAHPGRGTEPAGEGGTSRISFRPPEELKARIEDAAEREGLSVNAFLVRTLTAALEPGRRPASRTDAGDGDHVSGWFS
jgi:hypothetical protein